MHIKNKRGQSTVEYILLVTAVVGVLIVFLTSSNSPFRTKLGNTYDRVVNDMNIATEILSNSHAPNGV
jgi:hypothetical protein